MVISLHNYRLASMGHSVVGIDVSEDGIAIVRKTYPNIRFEVYSAYDDLSTLIEEVDLIVLSEVIEYLFRPKLFLLNTFEILRSGGTLILITLYHDYLKNLILSLSNTWDKHHTVDWEGGHVKFFSEKILSKMLNDVGFEKPIFSNTGRVKWLWKSMVLRANKPKA